MALPDQEEGKTYFSDFRPKLEDDINTYTRFIRDFVGLSYCVHLFPFPVFFWATRLSGLFWESFGQRQMAIGLAPIVKMNIEYQYSLYLLWKPSKAVTVRIWVSSHKATYRKVPASVF